MWGEHNRSATIRGGGFSDSRNADEMKERDVLYMRAWFLPFDTEVTAAALKVCSVISISNRKNSGEEDFFLSSFSSPALLRLGRT